MLIADGVRGMVVRRKLPALPFTTPGNQSVDQSSALGALHVSA